MGRVPIMTETLFCNGCQHHRALCMFPNPDKRQCSVCIEKMQKKLAAGKTNAVHPAQERQRKRRYLAGILPPFAR